MPLLITAVSRDADPVRHVFDQERVTIGRVTGNDLVLRQSNVSKQHAAIIVQDDLVILQDLGSTNGTWVNNQRIRASQIISSRDRVLVGDFELRLEFSAPSDPVHAEPETSDAPLYTSPPEDETLPPLEARSEAAQRRHEETPARGVAAAQGQRPNSLTWPPARHWSTPEEHDERVHQRLAALLQSPPSDTGRGHPASILDPDAHGLDETALVKRIQTDRQAPFRDLPSSLQPLLTDVVSHMLSISDEHRTQGSYPPDHETILRVGTEAVRSYEVTTQQAIEERERNQLIHLVGHELLGLGPIEAYLAWPEVTAIDVLRHDRILLQRGTALEEAPVHFAMHETFQRAVQRLSTSAGLSERHGGRIRMDDGLTVDVLQPPLSAHGPSLHVRRPRVEPRAPQDMVHEGTMDPRTAELLQAALDAGASIVVTSQRAEAAHAVLLGLLGAGSTKRRSIRLTPQPPTPEEHPTGITLAATGPHAVNALRRAMTLEPDLLVLDPLQPDIGHLWLNSVTAQPCQTLLRISARSTFDALLRLEALVTTGSTPASGQLAQRLLASNLDLMVRVDHLSDGRLFVAEVSEVLAGADGLPLLHPLHVLEPHGESFRLHIAQEPPDFLQCNDPSGVRVDEPVGPR